MPDLSNPLFKGVKNQSAYLDSRNSQINVSIKPGPYKELLPCADLCHKLVQACPAALGFACPSDSKSSTSYGMRGLDLDGNPMCNDPGAFLVSGATRLICGTKFLAVFVAVMASLLLGMT